MYVVEVIPVGRGMSADTFSYFSSIPHPRGTLLSVPVRQSQTLGVVVGATEVSTMKTALRAATFTLRRLPEQSGAEHVSTEFLETVDRVATYHAAGSGAVLFALLPKEIRSGSISLTAYAQRPRLTLPREPRAPEVLIAREDERVRAYVQLVRESFANQSSIVVIVPTLEHARQMNAVLGSGVEEHTRTLTSAAGVQNLKEAYRKIAESVHPILIIATPPYAFIERSDIGTVILEHARSSAYVGHVRPYVDYRHALQIHSALYHRRIIIGDTLIRAEDEHALRTQRASPFGEHPNRIEFSSRIRTISMKKDPDGVVAFSLFSTDLIARLRDVVREKERAFLFAARRGIAPIVACVDCGHIMRSPESGEPLSLHRRMKGGVEERWFISSVSGYRERARDVCPSCSGWRLRERGIGIQHVYDELVEAFPEIPIVLFDHTTATTPKKAAALRDSFYTTKGSLMLGTALAIPYIVKPVKLSAVVSLDSLKAIPSWRQQEEALGLILTLREKTSGTLLIQTRSDDDGLLEFAEKGSTEAFYDHELALRETYQYPPFSTFVHLTWQGQREGVLKVESAIHELFASYSIAVYGSPESSGEKVVRYGLIRVPAARWPDSDIIAKLRTLPPAVRIMINPDRII